VGALLSSCSTPRPEADFEGSFDAAKVTQLCHEAYHLARNATFSAQCDLEFRSYDATRLDWEAVRYLHRVTKQVPWIARAAERNAAAPRDSSVRAYALLAHDAQMLRERYRPASFASSTQAQIERLLGLLDEIASSYRRREP
jgi:hypothetical protein